MRSDLHIGELTRVPVQIDYLEMPVYMHDVSIKHVTVVSGSTTQK
jgi:hypothetical protein